MNFAHVMWGTGCKRESLPELSTRFTFGGAALQGKSRKSA